MKPSSRFSLRRRAFTLIELMVTITIIAMLAGLAIFAMRQAIVSSNRNKTKNYLKVMVTLLQRYESDNGTIPRPKSGSESMTIDVAGTTYEAGGGVALYQAFTADGDDALEGGSTASTGVVGSIADAEVYWGDADPKGAHRITKQQDGMYFIQDGFGVPFQYRVPPLPSSTDEKTKKEDDDTVYHNPNSYDLWSYGGDYGNENSWITNW